MKTFIVSLITFFIIITLITIFVIYLNNSTETLELYIKKISDYAENDDWEKALKTYNIAENYWNNGRKTQKLFINHQEIDRCDELLKEIETAIKYKDKTALINKLKILKLIIENIYNNELPTFENII